MFTPPSVSEAGLFDYERGQITPKVMKHLKKIKKALKLAKLRTSPNAVALIADELGLNLTSQQIVEISNKL